MSAQILELVLLGMLAVIAIAVLRSRDLFVAVMLFSIYSLVSASLFLLLDAADVAFTEAAVGAGVSTLLMLATLARTPCSDRRALRLAGWLTLGGAALVYGITDLPAFGAPDNPVHVHVASRYVERSGEEIGIPNIVTSVLASYRGYDTLGEVVVIFTAGIGVLALIGRSRRRRRG